MPNQDWVLEPNFIEDSRKHNACFMVHVTRMPRQTCRSTSAVTLPGVHERWRAPTVCSHRLGHVSPQSNRPQPLVQKDKRKDGRKDERVPIFGHRRTQIELGLNRAAQQSNCRHLVEHSNPLYQYSQVRWET